MITITGTIEVDDSLIGAYKSNASLVEQEIKRKCKALEEDLLLEIKQRAGAMTKDKFTQRAKAHWMVD